MTSIATPRVRPVQSFPTEPIHRLLQQRADDLGLTITELADVLRLPRRTLCRLLKRPRLRWDTADRVAIALGHHPGEIWPGWYSHLR